MKDECLRIQEAISRAVDGDPVAAEEAALAKRHCAECPECAAFVRTLAHLRTVPAPRAPEESVARAIVAGKTLIEADAAKARESAAAEPPTDESEKSRLHDVSMPPSPETVPTRTNAAEAAPQSGRRRISSSTIGAVAGVAAVLFIAMIVTAQGLRTINNPQETGSVTDSETLYSTPEEDATTQKAPESAAEAGIQLAAPAAPGYVVFEGTVYGFTGLVDEDTADSPRLGTVRTALDSGGTPQQRTVYDATSQDRILIDANGVYAFAPVTRTFEGARFVMRSEPVEGFGDWPTLPSGIPEPSAPDGSPVFRVAGESNGLPVYARAGRDAEDGFALAPDSPQEDPASGNPGWTWWEPQE